MIDTDSTQTTYCTFHYAYRVLMELVRPCPANFSVDRSHPRQGFVPDLSDLPAYCFGDVCDAFRAGHASLILERCRVVLESCHVVAERSISPSNVSDLSQKVFMHNRRRCVRDSNSGRHALYFPDLG